MGIKGIYGEIGPGTRVALSKVAIEKLEQSGRPLRIAIDISIWQFQVQSGRGGTNPALRTLYYRLLRLLSLPIQPLFIFDGTNKPEFKRHVRTSSNVASLPNMLAKQMLTFFGFPYLTAPGEAEAECALLQRRGIVDAVFSGDVDTLMFGSTLTIRNWSSEGTRGKSPTHVDMYDSKSVKQGKAALDREGMVLIALMSGGDYVPAGIPGCGIKIACEAARAGFGQDLCKISRKDKVGLAKWRARLEHELRTNESGFFRVKHKALKVPEAFPDRVVLSYYTHPVVSSLEKTSQLQVEWEKPIDIPGLRQFVADAFEWQHLLGAKKFIRGLAPALLAKLLMCEGPGHIPDVDDNLDLRAEHEKHYVKTICGKRNHTSTDGTPELRVAYVPAGIVGLDLEKEESDDYVGINGSDSDIELELAASEEEQASSPTKKRGPSQYDPLIPEKIWLLESIVKLGVPLTVEIWEEDMRNPKKFVTRKSRERSKLAESVLEQGKINAFLKTTKPSLSRVTRDRKTFASEAIARLPSIPPRWVLPTTPTKGLGPRQIEKSDSETRKKCILKKTPSKKPSLLPSSPLPVDTKINPWTLSRRPSDTFDVRLDKGKRYSALGLYGGSPGSNGAKLDNSQSDRNVALIPSPLCLGELEHNRISSTSSEDAEKRPALKKKKPKKNIPIIDVCSSPELPSKDPRRTGSLTEVRDHAVGSHTIVIEQKVNDLESEGTPQQFGQDQPDTTPLCDMDSQAATRRLIFNLDVENQALSFSPSSSSLPTLSPLLAPQKRASLSYRTSNRQPRKSSSTKVLRRNVVLRESLEGAWKVLDDWEVLTVTPRRVLSRVDCLDLTST